MKKIVTKASLFLVLASSAFLGNAQQDPMYSQYMFNMLTINPAYAGSRNVVSVTGVLRNQWLGIEGAPVTQNIGVDLPIAAKRVGLGLNVVNDKLGLQHTTTANLSYSYRLRLGRGVLSLGLQGGVNQYSADFRDVLTTSYVQSGNTNQDPAFNLIDNKILPNFGAGLYYSTDGFYMSLSAPKLLQHKLVQGQSGLSNAKNLARQYRHYFFGTGFVVNLSDAVKFKPSFLVKAVEGAPIQLDVNANLWFGGRVGIGASYRSGDAILGMLELQLTKQFRLGYAYDVTLTRLKKHTTGSHEIMLRYETGYERSKMLSPRYF